MHIQEGQEQDKIFPEQEGRKKDSEMCLEISCQDK